MLIPYFVFMLYQLLMLSIAPIFIAFAIFSNSISKTGEWQQVKQIMGFVPQANEDDKKVIWIHGYRLGELIAVQQFIKELKAKDPSIVCYLTIQEAKEKKEVANLLKPDYVSVIPHDNIISMKLAFNRIKPYRIILLEREIRPTLVMLARKKNIPIYLVNAQVSIEDDKRFETFPFFYRSVLPYFTHIFAQSDFDKMAFAQCGVAPNQASVLGNIKAFNSYRKMRSSGVKDSLYHNAAKHQVLIAGSIYENELDHYINLFKELKREFPSLKLVLCPRFFEWKTKLIDKVKKLGYSYGVWDDSLSNVADPHKEIVTKFQSLLDNNDIVTVFVMGTLFHLCALSDIYYLGGTFVPVGGHNLLDSASWGSPMVVGPHYYMTKHIADDLEEAGALIKVSKGKELLEVTRKLLSNDEKMLAMREKAKKWIKKEYEFVERQVCRLITMLLNGKEKY